MKYLKIPIFLMVLMIMGSFPGIYAINMVQHDSMNISENNNVTDGARTIYVAKNGTDRNDGLTPETPKRNIENALIAANPGDIIRVASGTYMENLQINKNITLIGDTQNTVIDGQNASNCITISPGVTVTIANFIIKNGGNNRLCDGGGMHNDGILNLENSTITNSTSECGGGIDNGGTMTISRVTIENNRANWNGGGIFNNGILTIKDSTITGNTAARNGGSIDNTATMTLSRVIIVNNSANIDGGGIGNNGLLTIEDSTITNNTAGSGGGIYNTNLLYVYGSTLIGNRATNGGGIFNSNMTFDNRTRAYIDDLTIITYNIPNNYAGKPFIPA
ncbi:DUF1565 domain-containing protein [Methanobacterium spitsbergense]|uniref:DUF1565 domain-containing protein n=1 Tax=Methanobacterium spitsbergense TaxID=2874285 RepID=A0A8T5ULA5_9EURY|nr:DUF1565 domain-containing protein [Methanobacterium spitsbergense]MBZ2164464.1 DUF1565 domain-containing protein [Methanobacterium spitsbergense]